jgi:uncharacterized protein (TIGR03437 family)
VHLGAYSAEVLYSGPVADYLGLWQVNVRIPSGFFVPGSHALTVAAGDAVTPPLQVEIK